MLVVEIVVGVVVGLWCWGALQRWASTPASTPELPEHKRKELAAALKDLSDKSPRRGPDGRWQWPDDKRGN
jgi:hypothetical protein